MEAMVQDLVTSLMAPVDAALAGMQAAIAPLWSAAAVIAGSMCFMMASAGMGAIVNRVMSIILTGVMAYTVLEYNDDMIDWSVGQAQLLAGLAGAGEAATTPYQVASIGMTLASRAFGHTDSWWNLLIGGPVHPILMALTGIAIVLCYGLITMLVISVHIEMVLAMLILMPAFALLVIGGSFTAAAVSPISFMISATCRLAGLALFATFGLSLIGNEAYGIPPTSEEITWARTLIALALTIILTVLAFRINSALAMITLGRSGWAGPAQAMTSAVSYGAGAAWSMAKGATGIGGGGGARGGGGGARGGGGSGGMSLGGGNQPVRRSTPVNSRSA